MAQLTLHPCTVQMNWLSGSPLPDADWKNILHGFLGELGNNCIENGASLIGHIKGIASAGGKPCLQFSLVALHD